jgi:AcrR family transcriptional regulator
VFDAARKIMASSSEVTTREAVLNYAVNYLWASDESDLRILDCSSKTGHSPSVIYAHFRSRVGLIDAAYVEIYRTLTTVVYDGLKEAASKCKAPGQFVDILHKQMLEPARWPFVLKRRELRLRIKSICLVRSSLRKSIAAVDTEFDPLYLQVWQELIDANQLGNTLSAAEWMRFFSSIAYTDLKHAASPMPPPAEEDWYPVARQMVLGSYS